jgi:hypothetical protein
MTALLCSAAPTELSLADYERLQNAKPDESAAEREQAIKRIASYLQHHVFKIEGRITETERTALNYFGLRMAEEFDEDSAEFLARLALQDATEAGMSLAKTAEKILLEVAEQYREDLETEARGWGYVR